MGMTPANMVSVVAIDMTSSLVTHLLFLQSSVKREEAHKKR